MKQQLLSLAQHPQFAARLKRAALYAAISVLACIGPFFPQSRWAELVSSPDWAKLNEEERQSVRAEYYDKVLGPITIEAGEEAWRVYTERDARIRDFDKGSLGTSMRLMALGSCFHTVAHNIGTVAGFFGTGVSENWASAKLKVWFMDHYPASPTPVRVAGYVGRWAGWWLCFLVLGLGWRYFKSLRRVWTGADVETERTSPGDQPGG